MGYGRDILYVKPASAAASQPENREMEQLHTMLMPLEMPAHVARCTEVADLNRFAITRKPHIVQQMLRQPVLKPFCFIINRN